MPKEKGEDKVRPKYEEMAYEDRWKSRKDRQLERRPQAAEEEEDESEGGGDGEGQQEEEEEQTERPQGRRGRPGRPGQAARRRQQRKNTVDAEEESRLTPTWIWDPATVRFQS